MSSRRSQVEPRARAQGGQLALRTAFWVLVVTLYLLGALSLVTRSVFDLSPASATATQAAIITAVAPATVQPTAATATTEPSPFPTLTPRQTLYPTLTPRP